MVMKYHWMQHFHGPREIICISFIRTLNWLKIHKSFFLHLLIKFYCSCIFISVKSSILHILEFFQVIFLNYQVLPRCLDKKSQSIRINLKKLTWDEHSRNLLAMCLKANILSSTPRKWDRYILLSNYPMVIFLNVV